VPGLVLGCAGVNESLSDPKHTLTSAAMVQHSHFPQIEQSLLWKLDDVTIAVAVRKRHALG